MNIHCMTFSVFFRKLRAQQGRKKKVRKTELKYETNNNDRRTKRCRRKLTVFEKAFELCTVTGGKIFIRYEDENGFLWTYASTDDAWEDYKQNGIIYGGDKECREKLDLDHYIIIGKDAQGPSEESDLSQSIVAPVTNNPLQLEQEEQTTPSGKQMPPCSTPAVTRTIKALAYPTSGGGSVLNQSFAMPLPPADADLSMISLIGQPSASKVHSDDHEISLENNMTSDLSEVSVTALVSFINSPDVDDPGSSLGPISGKISSIYAIQY